MIEVPATSGAPDGDESDFAVLFSKSSRPLWLYDPDSLRFIAVNDATVESSGWSREELLTKTLSEVTAPEQKDFCRSPLSNENGNGALHPWQHRTKDGSFTTAQTYRRSLRYNGKDAVLIVALRSDPDSGETESAVPGEQSDFATDAIIIRDFEDRIVFWNKGAERIYGWSAAETIGAKVADFFNNDHANFGDAAGALLSRGRWDSQLDQQRKSGERVLVKTRWALLGGLPAGNRSIIMVDTDLAEAKKLQWQFLRAQRLQAVGTLAGGISHDLNNTLSPVLMSVGVLRQMAKDATTKRMLDIIEASAERSARIVKQVFTFARGIDGEPVLLQPKHLLADLARITTQTFPRNIDVQTDVPSELSTISADATQIHQLLLNLCVNARDAMPNGGTLTISAENVEVDEHFARTNPGAQLGPHVLLRVADTGAGIPPETLRKIFAPFVTTKKTGKGSGLGLAAVMKIVKSHGGFVMVDTEVGAGTTFKVFLPASKDAALPEQKEEGDPIVGGNGELVLVVDDEILIREALVSTLQSNGYHVFTAEDGTDALALYFQRGTEIDLILTDISMGQMDGITLVRSLRRLKSDVPVIVASAQLQKENRAILHGYGVKNFLNKPYTANRLLRELRAVLDGRPAK